MRVLMISTPYKASSKFGEIERRRVLNVLLLQTCKRFKAVNIESRLYSNLLFTLLFNIP